MEFAPKETDDGESDVEFVSDIKGGSVPKEYIPGVQKGIESVLGNGVVAGFPVLGIKVRMSSLCAYFVANDGGFYGARPL